MPDTHVDNLKVGVSGTPGTGTATIGSAASGCRGFVAGDDGKTFSGRWTDGTAWETATGCVYTHSGTTLTRGTLKESSTGSAISLTSAAVFECSPVADLGNRLEAVLQSAVPGGRLTLESGVPVSTTDQTAKTTIYYTPFLHNIINLWDGANWKPTTFSEISLALGTLTSGKPYDVFGYLSGGALALELLAWTSDTARATAVTLQDGRYCKSGDKTRLWLGSFYTASTTTTEDSDQNRYLFNMYNRVPRRFFYDMGSGSHTYASSTFREYNGVTTSRVRLLNGIKDQNVMVGAGAYTFIGTAGQQARIGVGVNSTSSVQGATLWDNSSTSPQRAAGAPYTGVPDLGFSYFACLEATTSGTGTFDAARLSGQWSC